MRRYDFKFNDVSAWEMGVAVARRVSIPTPEKRGEFVQVAGRDGSLFVSDGTYEDIAFPIEMNFVRRRDLLMQSYRKIKNWLNGSGTIVFSNDSEVFYKVKSLTLSDFGIRGKQGADVVANVVADPFSYYRSGVYEYNLEEVLLNPYHECCPIYKVQGTGDFVLTVNGKSFVGRNGSMTIDTDKMISYNSQMQRAKVSGDYEDIRLKSGENEIHITSGFTVKVVPNWRSL